MRCVSVLTLHLSPYITFDASHYFARQNTSRQGRVDSISATTVQSHRNRILAPLKISHKSTWAQAQKRIATHGAHSTLGCSSPAPLTLPLLCSHPHVYFTQIYTDIHGPLPLRRLRNASAFLLDLGAITITRHFHRHTLSHIYNPMAHMHRCVFGTEARPRRLNRSHRQPSRSRWIFHLCSHLSHLNIPYRSRIAIISGRMHPAKVSPTPPRLRRVSHTPNPFWHPPRFTSHRLEHKHSSQSTHMTLRRLGAPPLAAR